MKRRIALLVLFLILGIIPGCSIPGIGFFPPEDFDDPIPTEDPIQVPEADNPGNDVPAGDMASPNDPTPAGNYPANPTYVLAGGPLKPVRFNNLGTVAYTVSPWTYAPPGGDFGPAGPNPSTVAFPGGNTSNYLSLPFGAYTWCYWWEIGDTNQDGIMEYAHALDERPVSLDSASPDALDYAVQVDLAAPAETGISYGFCGLDFAPFVIENKHVDKLQGALLTLAHDTDSVTLAGPITFILWYMHAPEQIYAGLEGVVTTNPETVVIPAGQTWSLVLEEWRDDHPGDWNAYLWLISVDQ